MTATSLLLLVLEPGPMAPLAGVTLMSKETASQPQVRLFDIPQTQDWRMIVIHDSGSPIGSSQSINRAHQQQGKGGLGYHFVINNGTDELDGLIEVGFRWQRQLIGAYYAGGDDATWYHRHAIGICLVGDGDHGQFTTAQMRELVWLVQQLQRRFNIPASAVRVEVGSTGQAPSFPYAQFDQQLLQHQAQ